VRRVRTEGPQHVTMHGRDEVVVVAAEEFRRLKGERSGATLIEALQASPYRDADIEPRARADAGARDRSVTGWLLDTNVLSELRRPKPEPKVAAFVIAQPLDLLYVSAVTLAEIRFGVERLPDAARRAELTSGSRTRCGRCSNSASCQSART